MAYKFQRGTAKLSGSITLEDNLQVDGNITLKDGSVNLADLDIDGGTDIGEALVDADLIIVDNGAGGTNRKAALSRIPTYLNDHSSLTSLSALTTIGTAGATTQIAAGDLTMYNAVNGGNPTISLGASATEALVIEAKFGDANQELNSITFETKTGGSSAHAGKMKFAVDEASIMEINDSGLQLKDSGVIGINSDTDLLTLTSGVLTVAGEVSMTTLDIGGVNVTSDAGELNLLDGSSAGTIANSKAVIYDGSGRVKANGYLTNGGTSVIDTNGNVDANTVSVGGTEVVSSARALSNIASLDATTESTIEAAIDTLANLTTIGTAGATTQIAAGDVTMYNAVNGGSPTFSIGASASEALVIEAKFGDANQELQAVTFETKTAGAGASAGKMKFKVDEASILEINDDGLELKDSAVIGIASDADLMTLTDGVLTVAGEVSMTTLDIGGTNVSATAAELNYLDNDDLTAADITKLAAIDATAAELNLLDGGTARGTTALASGDGFVHNDAGTMRMTSIDKLADFFAGDGLASSSGVMSVGVDDSSIELNSDALRIKASGVTNAMLAGSIANAKLVNDGITIGTADTSLGGTVTALVGLTDLDATASDLTIFDTQNNGNTLTIGHANGKVTIAGDLVVSGDTITADVAKVTIEDPIMGLGYGAAGTSTTGSAADRGLVLGLGSENAFMGWDNSEGQFAFMKEISTHHQEATVGVTKYGDVRAASFIGLMASSVQSIHSGSLNPSGGQIPELKFEDGDVVVADAAASGSFTIVLPDAANNAGKILKIKKTSGTNTLTINGSGSQTIDGEDFIIFESAFAGASFICDGANYFVL